jgi:hypothetical protein
VIGRGVTNQPRVDRVSVCPVPLLPESGYLIVDPGAFPNIDELDFLQPLVCTPTNWGRDFTGLPAIIDLARCDVGQRDWLASVINAEHESRLYMPLTFPSVCAYVEASVDANTLARHLANQLLVLPVEKGGHQALAGALWRFFDPRVFANLCWILEPGHLTTLVGPVSRWVFPWLDSWYEFNANDFEFSKLDSVSEVAPLERIGGFARIDIEVWDRTQRIATINKTLARIGLPSELPWQEKAAMAAVVESALIEAQCRLHWKQAEDQMSYAEHIARYGAAFRNHPRLVDHWPKLETRVETMSCSELIALLSHDEYRAFAQPTGAGDTSVR